MCDNVQKFNLKRDRFPNELLRVRAAQIYFIRFIEEAYIAES